LLLLTEHAPGNQRNCEHCERRSSYQGNLSRHNTLSNQGGGDLALARASTAQDCERIRLSINEYICHETHEQEDDADDL
jgi:hypothetical protein